MTSEASYPKIRLIVRLLLTSSGITNKTIEETLRDLLREPFSKASLVFIPTAANPEKGDKSWLKKDINNFRKLGFSSFDVIDISKVERKYWEPVLRHAHVLVFGGGNVYYLLKWIRKAGFDKLLNRFIKTKVYVGISAGSMITARNIFLTSSEILYYEETGKIRKTQGLGFVNFEIRPHLNSKWFPKLTLPNLEKMAREDRNTFYAIDDNTAIMVLNNKISIISEGVWKKFN